MATGAAFFKRSLCVSCSQYAILALQKYGLLIGSIKAVRRLLRCGPPGGIDYP